MTTEPDSEPVCPDCGYVYEWGHPWNKRDHHKRHAMWRHANHPEPDPALVGLGPFVRVSGKLNAQLYEISWALTRENKYRRVASSRTG